MIHTLFDALIFDFDGVIIDSEYIHYEAYCPIFANIGLTISYEDYMKETYTGMSDKDMFQQLLINKGYNFLSEQIDEFFNIKIAHYAEIIHYSDLLPMIKDIDQYITHVAKDGKKLAICTGSTRQEVLLVLSKLANSHLLAYFDAIVTAEDVCHAKPSPDGYLLAAKKLGILPNKCLAIEDSPQGIDAAKSAGMYALAIATTHESQQLTKADKIITRFSELISL